MSPTPVSEVAEFGALALPAAVYGWPCRRPTQRLLALAASARRQTAQRRDRLDAHHSAHCALAVCGGVIAGGFARCRPLIRCPFLGTRGQ
jgi:hypothetical protein